MITDRSYAIRPAETDADLERWRQIRRLVHPDEPPPTIDLLKAEAGGDRLLVLVELGGELIGSGLADRSQTTGSFVAPRILPDHRRRGAGTAVLRHLMGHLAARGFATVGGHAEDDGALAFATAHGFEEVDRQIELLRHLTPDEPAAPPYEGVDITTVAQHPELLQRAYALARQGFADMALRTGPAIIDVDAWLREEASLPGGSFVALEYGVIVGYAGLLAWDGDASRAENGLTVVDRRWRGRGLATALKRRQLAWAAANGIGLIVTWTQADNAAMRRVNEKLGYETPHDQPQDAPRASLTARTIRCTRAPRIVTTRGFLRVERRRNARLVWTLDTRSDNPESARQAASLNAPRPAVPGRVGAQEEVDPGTRSHPTDPAGAMPLPRGVASAGFGRRPRCPRIPGLRDG